MDMPFHLRTLPPEALEIIRYYSGAGTHVAHADAIQRGTDLSDRGFGKAIRRLVTKGYLTLDGEQRYRLTDSGQRAVDDFRRANAASPEMFRRRKSEEITLERRLIVALPRTVVADEAARVYVGFPEALPALELEEPLNVLLRINVVNGKPESTREYGFLLDSDSSKQEIEITPGRYTQARLRVQVFQVDDVDEARLAGGLYVDLDVLPPGSAGDGGYVAYGANTRFVVSE